ncbi:hypothetical protein NL676_018302 [Syzygium grande]|nr:hypothetical protein NL676_018302 [Syzygium grande]
MALVDVEPSVMVAGVMDAVLLRVEVVEVVVEALVVVALAIVIIVKGQDIQRLIATPFIPSFHLLLPPMWRWKSLPHWLHQILLVCRIQPLLPPIAIDSLHASCSDSLDLSMPCPVLSESLPAIDQP